MGQHTKEKGKEREKSSHSHSHSHRDKDRDESRRKRDKKESRDKREKDGRSSSSSSKHRGSKVVDDDEDDEQDIWVEKEQDANNGEPPSISNIPTRDSLALTSKALPSSVAAPSLPHSVAAESASSNRDQRRDEWMLSDQAVQPSQSSNNIRQSENTYNGGTFDIGDVPTGIARPNEHNTVEQFTDGYGEGEVGTKGTFGGDFFSSLGQARKKKSPPPAAKARNPDAPKMSSKEINTAIYAADGSRLASSTEAINSASGSGRSQAGRSAAPPTPGSAGSNWRMMKVRRVYETANEEGRDVDEVGIEKFGGSREDWEAAKEEKRLMESGSRGGQRGHPRGLADRSRSHIISRDTPDPATGEDGGLDEFGRERRPASQSTTGSGAGSGSAAVAGRYIFSDPAPGSNPSSRPPSRAGSFRRPGSYAGDDSRPSTPAPPGSTRERMEQRAAGRGSQPSTPIPSVFTPPPPMSALRKPSQLQESSTATVDAVQDAQAHVSGAAMSPTSLNKLQAKILRLRLLGGDSAELKALEEQYEAESVRSRQGDGGAGYFDMQEVGAEQTHSGADGRTQIKVLPTLDGRGRLYDVGKASGGGGDEGDGADKPGNKRKRGERYFETRDTATGELLRYNADDDSTTLEEMVRQERFGGGSGDQKNMDVEMATRIAGDGKFEDDLDYMDDQAERLARKKMKSDQQKKMFAINDYAKTKKALESCSFCYQDTDRASVPPQAAMVALGTRTYLALPVFEPLVEGHALIVPIQHHLSTLEADDDTWDEIKNFMKTLMQLHAEQDKGVMFFETVLSFKGQRHTYIEAVPVPWALFEELPSYFREGILSVEAEWSQHQKLIDFSKRPGGFRRALVPNLPYFMVHWDYKGEKGFGHVVEGAESATGAGDGYDFDEGAKGGGEFPRYFAQEIMGNLMDLPSRLWRKPKRMDKRQNQERIDAFRKGYDRFDWTKMLAQTRDQ